MAAPCKFSWSYADLAKLTPLSLNAVWQHVRRRNLDPSDLESVIVWLARHGTLTLRQRLVRAALTGEVDHVKPPRSSRKACRSTRKSVAK